MTGLADSSPRVREQTVRIAETKLNSSENVFESVLALVGDDDFRVRFQTAFSLGEYEGSRSEEM